MRSFWIALLAALTCAIGIVIACSTGGDDDDDCMSADCSGYDDDDYYDDDDTSDATCADILGNNVEECFDGTTTEEVCDSNDADCWTACFNASETCEEWQMCLETSCGVTFE